MKFKVKFLKLFFWYIDREGSYMYRRIMCSEISLKGGEVDKE